MSWAKDMCSHGDRYEKTVMTLGFQAIDELKDKLIQAILTLYHVRSAGPMSNLNNKSRI